MTIGKKYGMIEKKNSEVPTTNLLDFLIKLDGFDSGVGRIEVNDWRNYVQLIGNRLELTDNSSVFEVGCGSGAFLCGLTEKYSNLHVGGIDYSSPLIETANEVFPQGDFKCLEAHHVNSKKKYDFVISNSVFHYFQLDYAQNILELMAEKAKKAVCILDIPDMNKKAESELVRSNALTKEEYGKKYAGLTHTYFKREWYEQWANSHGFVCELFDGCIPNYTQSQFRFGCIIHK